MCDGTYVCQDDDETCEYVYQSDIGRTSTCFAFNTTHIHHMKLSELNSQKLTQRSFVGLNYNNMP